MEERVLARGVFSQNTRGIKIATFSIICFSILFIVSLFVTPIFSLIFLGWIIYDIIQIVRCLRTQDQILVVTDKRIYGTLEGKHIELPLDKISSVETVGQKRIQIATASGTINCMQCENRADVVKAISELLKKRNASKSGVAPLIITKSEHIPSSQTSSADEIRKYKALLDDGIITQEEFDTKKKELLGI